MLPEFANSWWPLLLRGICAILFGVMAFIWPGLSLLTLVFLYGAYALVDGVFALFAAAAGRGGQVPTWWLVLVGLLGIGVGFLTFLWPGITAFALLVMIAVWAIIKGIFEIAGAIALRKHIENEGLLILAGLASVAFGVLLLIAPGAGALAPLRSRNTSVQPIPAARARPTVSASNAKLAVRAPIAIVARAPSNSARFGDMTSARATPNRCSL